MALNPNISLAVKGLEVQDPLAQYGKVMAIQGAQQQNQLMRMQMEQAQREQESSNALDRAYAEAYNPQTGEVDVNRLRQSLATGGLGSKLPAIEKNLLEMSKAKTEQQKAQTELLDAKLKQSRGFLDTIDPNAPGAAEAYIAWHEANHKDPIIGPALAARGVTADQSRGRIMQMIQTPGGLARLINESKLGTEKFMEFNKPVTQVIDQSGQRQVIQIPGLGGTPTTVGTYADVPLPADVEAQKARVAAAGAARTTIKLPEQEKAFESKLGEGQAKRILDSKAAAEDAAQILQTNQVGRDILKSGAITGTGAEFFVGLNNALKQAGIDFGYADAAANSQAYAAALGGNVGKIIKQFGAGTGLSDADRKFAEEMAGRKITLTETAMRRILDINDRVANRVIDLHNKDVQGIKTNIPLTVEKPTAAPQRAAPTAGIPGQGTAPAPARTVTRTGTLNGRKVIQYSDGSVEYGN